LVVINIDQTQVKSAQNVLENSGAVDIENLTEKWDPSIWSQYKGFEAPVSG
jgi:hypothetical protein